MRAKRALLAGLAALLLGSSLAPALASPAAAQTQDPPPGLAKTGPIDPEHGFPFWYEDSGIPGPEGRDPLRLDLCLDTSENSKCLRPFEMPDETAPMVFPDNFPGEAFWWTGEASIDRADGGRALLVLAQEAAFANENPREGDQMSFGRIRVRLDQLTPGATYTVTHPYGVDEVVAEEDGSIFVTEDIGCFPSPVTPCNFDKALDGRVGPFLTWDTFGSDGPDAPPAGYVGDPDVAHKVVGSPYGTNIFKVEGPNVGGPGVNTIETDLFSVSGKLAELQVKAVGAGAERAETVFNDPEQEIELVASDPAAEIFYSRNDEPLVDAEGNVVGTPYDPSSGGIALRSTDAAAGADTKLNFIAIRGEQRSEVFSKTFTLDLEAPNLTFSHPAGLLEGPTDVTLATNERARIYYTTDGSNPDPRAEGNANNPAIKTFEPAEDPNAASTEGTIKVTRSQTVRAIAADVDPANNEADVNFSRSKSAKYDISNLKPGPVNPQNGFPFWYEDYGLKNDAGELVRDPVRLDLCLNPTPAPEPGGGYCATPFEMPADWQPADGVAFPDRFPGEAFWFTAESGMETSEDGEADLIMATEAAFLNEEPKASDRMVFGRIRIRIDDLVAGKEYKVTHPYGIDKFVAEPVRPGSEVGEINTTEDIGCMIPSEAEPCDFNEAGFGRVGPYLTLANPAQEPTDAPDGGSYLADPVTDEDLVTGSPYGTNFFRVEGPGLQGTSENPVRQTQNGTPYLQTDFFSIVGKYSEFQAAASKIGDTYNAPQDVTLGASEFDARIFYTTSGNDPRVTTDADGNFVAGEGTREFIPTGDNASAPISVLDAQESTTLKYQAYSASQPEPTQVYTETYTLDSTAPDAPAGLALDAASNGGDKTDTLTNDTTPTFVGTAEPGSTIRISEGAKQLGSGRADAGGNFSITASVLGAGTHSITATVTDRAGNTSMSTTLEITIDDQAPAAPAANPDGGTYTADQLSGGVSLSAEPETSIYYTTGEATPTPDSDPYANPIPVSASETINAIAVDRAGNESDLASFDYTIRRAANTPPSVTVLNPDPGSTIRDRTPTIRARVTDEQTNLRRADIRLVIDGQRVTGFTYDRRRDILRFTPDSRMSLGRHTVRIVATDAQGERTPKSWSFRIVRP